MYWKEINLLILNMRRRRMSRAWPSLLIHPDSKVQGANMGPPWVLSAPDGPHVGPINLAIGADALEVSNFSGVSQGPLGMSDLAQPFVVLIIYVNI